MSMELWQRLKDLEKKVAELEVKLKTFEPAAKIDEFLAKHTSSPDEPPAKKMSVCPKCGVKPAYFFHVKHCKGNAEVA